MTGYPKWPHLESLDRVPDFLQRATDVAVTEKIHGFNARFGRTPEGAFWVGSRNNVVLEIPLTHDVPTDYAPKEPLQGFTAWALANRFHASTGITFFGEWAGRGIQKGVDYGEKQFYLFGVGFQVNESPVAWGGWSQIPYWSERLECLHAPLLYYGPARDITNAQLVEWSQQKSELCDDQAEGICISAWPMLTDEYGRTLIAKLKAPQFAERAHARKEKGPPPDLSTVQAFVDDYATDERLSHVLDQIREANPYIEDVLDREHTGVLLKAYYQDVVREGRDDYAKLSEDDQKLVGKVLNTSVKALVDARRMQPLT